MTSMPLSWISDEELQARIDRFVGAAVEAEERFERTGDPVDHAESERHWWAVFDLSLAQAERARHAA